MFGDSLSVHMKHIFETFYQIWRRLFVIAGKFEEMFPSHYLHCNSIYAARLSCTRFVKRHFTIREHWIYKPYRFSRHWFWHIQTCVCVLIHLYACVRTYYSEECCSSSSVCFLGYSSNIPDKFVRQVHQKWFILQ